MDRKRANRDKGRNGQLERAHVSLSPGENAGMDKDDMEEDVQDMEEDVQDIEEDVQDIVNYNWTEGSKARPSETGMHARCDDHAFAEYTKAQDLPDEQPNRPHVRNEDALILKYVIRSQGSELLQQDHFWKMMQAQHPVPGRSWRSLKEKFVQLLLELDDFFVEDGDGNTCQRGKVGVPPVSLSGIAYKCPVTSCIRNERPFYRRDNLMDHVRRMHSQETVVRRSQRHEG